MYRTSFLREEKILRLISKEMSNGFDYLFKICSGNEKTIRKNIQSFCKKNHVGISSKLEEDLIVCKILGLYKEIQDPDYLYTFDEHGEWLLSKMLSYVYKQYQNSDHYDEDDTEISKFWKSSLNDEEIEYLKEFARDYVDNLKKEMDDLDDEDYEYDFERDYKYLVGRIQYFPLMAMEMTEYVEPEFIFWDDDYTFIDELGVNGFEEMKKHLEKMGMNLGFMNVTESNEFYTGSEKYSFDDEEV